MLHSFRILTKLRYPNGLFLPTSKRKGLAWVRENIYQAIGLEAVDPFMAVRTYHMLLDLFLRKEKVLDYLLRKADKKKPNKNNQQFDALGLFLFKIGDMEQNAMRVLRDEHDRRLIQKLVCYLNKVQYWQTPDTGMWNAEEKLHAVSLGACVAGLRKVEQLVHVPEHLMTKGERALQKLLARKTIEQNPDLALLALIFPLNIVNEQQREYILTLVEDTLVRYKGVVRFPGDLYCYKGREAEWPLGFAWLAAIYKKLGDTVKQQFYVEKALDCLTEEGAMPELYYANTKEHNQNMPFGMGHAMLLQAME